MLSQVIERLGGRPLRVATMCSGTEAPIIALQKISKALLEDHQREFKFESVFSCEIEPFKQAYIERNFKPPILFRDVCELGNGYAHTAYGSLVAVPGQVDLLVAGTSCVDYSGLNTKQKGLEDGGESGQTFMGMLRYVKKENPTIVILENVSGAPWTDEIQEKKRQKATNSRARENVGKSIEGYFREIGYFGSFVRVDTKEFSLPHTRVRGYFMATKVKGLSEGWKEETVGLKRGWTVPMDGYLLPADHPDIAKARAFYARKQSGEGGRNSRTDWSRCESRHARARLEEMLGNRRPLTQWKEAGVVKGLDHTWNDWLAAQTERVVDLLDINMLREAMRGVDPNYKSYLWNVSQNVDRSTASGHIGLAPCLTPAMIPYLPARGGPATGREALALQGIDYMDLHLTVETEDNLADLAGNAMSTPVVSAAMLAALAVSASLLKPGDGSEGRGETLIAGSHSVEVVEDENLQNGTIDLTHSQSTSLKDLLKRAHINARRCICEGGLKSASTGILQCVACLTTTCGACGGRPEHMLCSFDGSDLSEQDWLSKSSGPVAEAKKSSGEDAEVKDSDAAAEGAVPALPSDVSLERQPPQVFERELKALVPMVVNLEGFSRESLDELFQASGRGVAAADWDMWASVVQKVRGTTFYFRSLARESCWVATYMSAVARLELRLHHAQPEWLLFATPTPDLAVGSRLRALLGNPVARRRLDLDADQLMPNGSWEILLPAKAVFQADFTGCGDLVDSWQASLGIEHPDFKDTKRWSRWTVEVPIEVEAELDRPISGTYVLLDKCGTSQSSLHRKLASDSDTHLPPLYLFHAPSLTGPLDEDAFVFSTDLSRGGFEYYRPIVAQLEASWRTHDRNGTAKIDLTVNGRWVPAPSIKFAEAEAGARGVEYKMADTLDTKVSQSNCRHAHTVLACEFPLPVSADGSIDELWRSEGWRDIDLRREGSSTFPKIAFITSRLPEIAVSGETATEATDCPLCAPKAPAIKWVRGTKGFIPIEDAAEATAYEIALKNRPTPFVVQVRADRGASTGYLRVAINTDSLAHQALASLPKRSADLAHHVVWKLNQDYTSGHEHVQRLFNLSSNRNDPQHAPPRHFKSNVHLRPEQLRSLTWMIEQETIPAHFTFEEKEIAEADLPSFGLRVEAQAKRSVQARGGVIADQVGYGKTAISIALISETKESTLPVGDSDLIPLKATLVIVPGHLTKQWLSEIAKFVSKGHLEVLAIKDAKDLSKYSIKDLEKADVILVPDRLLDSPVYWERFTYFSAHPGTLPDDKTGGRMFRETLQGAMENLRKQARRFRDGKFDEASAAIAQAQKDAAALAAEEARVAQEEAAKGRKAAKSKKEPKEPKKPKAKAGKDDVKSDLKDKSVKENFKNLKGLPFQFFHFKRIIADEFTYLKGRTLVSILGLEASARWILSGTPPVEDFGAIKGIAAHLGIHLGIDDDRQGLSVAKNNKDKTAAERFHGFRDVRSSAWHASRDDLAQAFLDQFVRQNVAEIDEIRRTEVIHKMNLTTAERVIYLELAHHLQSIDMQAKGPKKYKDVSMGDRASRLLEVLEDSKDAEEALLKRAAHFSPLRAEEEDKASDAVEACEGILQTRIRQRVKCQRDLASEMALCRQLANKIRELGGYPVDRQDPSRRPPIEEFCRAAFNNKLSGDRFADRLIADLLDTEGFTPAGKLKDEEDVEIGNKEKLDDVVYALREHVVIMRKLSKELAGRCRSLRFFDVIRKLQRGGEEKEAVLESCICEHRGAAGVEFGVLSCCGHVACMDCLQKFADQQRCVHDAEICAAPVRITNIVSVPTITQAGKDEHLGPFGTKLQRVVEIIKKIPKGERCLVFVQFDEMFKIVEQALLAADISCVTLAGGTAAHKAATLEKFQDPGSKMQVLLLDIDRSTASGANLTVANHIIFLSPLKTATQAQFEATETQAIGRAVRYGQTKPMVWIHRIFAMDTVDVDIMKKRRPGLKLDDGVEWTWNAGEKKWVCSGMAAEVVDLDGDGDVEMV